MFRDFYRHRHRRRHRGRRYYKCYDQLQCCCHHIITIFRRLYPFPVAVRPISKRCYCNETPIGELRSQNFPVGEYPKHLFRDYE